jgi:hypothetical protein
VVAFPQHRDRGEHPDDQKRRDEHEDPERTTGKVRSTPRDDDGDEEAEADEDRGDDPEDDVVPVHEARIR